MPSPGILAADEEAGFAPPPQAVSLKTRDELQKAWRIGDLMQSSLARLCEFVERERGHAPVPYEVIMAVLEGTDAVSDWTEFRAGRAWRCDTCGEISSPLLGRDEAVSTATSGGGSGV